MPGRSLFLFGAGASAFSGECYPNTPPLGDQLLDRMVRDGFLNADFLQQRGDAFKGPGGFERGMACLAESHINVAYMGFMREVGRFFCRYSPGEKNVYVTWLRQMIASGEEFGVASLNYETLVEQAYSLCGRPVYGDGVSPK